MSDIKIVIASGTPDFKVISSTPISYTDFTNLTLDADAYQITVRDSDVYWTSDGSTPTTSSPIWYVDKRDTISGAQFRATKWLAIPSPSSLTVQPLSESQETAYLLVDSQVTKTSTLVVDNIEGTMQVLLNTNNPTGDAFGRLRVSNPTTLFDSKQIHDDPDLEADVENQPLFYDNTETSGSGTSTLFNVNKAQTTLSVSASTAGTRVRQTRQRFNYQPGKSQLVFLTWVMSSPPTAGITRREGLFDERNGIFFEDNGSTYGIVRRTYVTGSAVDIRVAQSSWNVDPMDGSGPSGINLNFIKTQILVIDFEWLGVGRVRIGWNVNGVTYWCHEFLNTNVLTEVYMSSPNNPIRTEISNDGTGAAASITQICSSIISEGGQESLGLIRTASTAGTHVDCNAENAWYAILGIRLKAAYLSTSIEILNVALQEHAGTKKLEWGLFFNPTVASALTYVDLPHSAIRAAKGATAHTVTGGFQIAGGFFDSGGVQSGNAGSATASISNALKLGSLINGTPDTIILCAKPIGGSTNADVEGCISWRELS